MELIESMWVAGKMGNMLHLQMQPRFLRRLLLISLIGIAWWLFGNLYEAIVIAPNLLHDTLSRTDHWRQFFITANPVFYYIPFVPVVIICLIIAALGAPVTQVRLRKRLQWAAAYALVAVLVSAYIIIQINLKLFYGDLTEHAESIPSLGLYWNLLNILRLLLLGMSLRYVFRAYLSYYFYTRSAKQL